MNKERVTLNNVARGNAGSLFARELARVLENIADSRSPATAARMITLEFRFVPSVDRTEITTSVNAKSKLPAAAGVSGLMYAFLDDGELVATNVDPTQLTLGSQLDAARLRNGGSGG